MFFLPMAHQVLLAAVALTAAVYDARFRRIPNWLTLSGVAVGVALNSFLNLRGVVWYAGFTWLTALAGMALAFAIYFPLYLVRGMGAGDVKLMASIGALTGPVNWLGIFVLSNVVGGLVAVVLLLARGRARKTFYNLAYLLNELLHFRPPYLRREELDVKSPKAMTLPHGVAIAIGCAVFLAALAWPK
jgi:prepilin peptidase CpaA